MPFLQQGQSVSVVVPAGHSIRVGAYRSASASVLIPNGLSSGPISIVSNQATTFGPYSPATTISVCANIGMAEYVVGLDPVLTDTIYGQSLYGIRSLSVEYASPDNLVAQFPDGTWLGTDNTAAGRYQGTYWFGTGAVTGLTKVEKTACRANTLLNKAGASIGGLGVWGAWILPNGNFLFVVNGSGNKWYLYLAKNVGGTVTVGANSPALNDGKPVMEIGEKAGTHIAGVNALHKRSLCVATIAGATVLLFGEYNVASGRVPGAANDLVRVLKSVDLGETWTTLIEWNTNGSTRQVSHVHGIVQDLDTGLIHILCGDNVYGGQIRWDGTSAAPAANTPIANFNGVSGWSALYDSTNPDYYRSGDMLFDGQKAAWLIDNFAFNTSRLATKRGPLLPTPGKLFTPAYGHDPLIGLATPVGYLWLSMFDRANFPAATRAFDVWFSFDLISWVNIGYLTDNSTASSTKIFDLFLSTDGRIMISASNGVSSLVAGSVGGTLICNLSNDFSGVYESIS